MVNRWAVTIFGHHFYLKILIGLLFYLTIFLPLPYNLYEYELYLQVSRVERGRNGFDGDNETEVACRGPTNLEKQVETKKCRNSACSCLIEGMPSLLCFPAALKRRRTAG